ncbi:MAG: MarR family transcriptional regulator [Candidatus Altiarchaeales archaeon]|nr:MarR family transcriptional regulator [Candidatus Altiarchaeales archaeon]MBD3416415.1 MarR family transcriptional regulator [Candidatus Altiarchaeales archaeon]
MRAGLREVGIVLILLAVFLVALLSVLLDTLADMSTQSCTCGESCEMIHFKVPPVFYGGLAGVVILFFIGIYLALKGGRLDQEPSGREKWLENLGSLDGDEKTVYQLISDSGGTIFQSEISEKTGLSKVKVTRNLDRLESKNLLERRRRGLTNIVVLK